MIYNYRKMNSGKEVGLDPNCKQNRFLLNSCEMDREYGSNFNGYGYSDRNRVYILKPHQVTKYNALGKENVDTAAAKAKRVENEKKFLETNVKNNAKIAEALYSVSKEAKRFRDLQSQEWEGLYSPWGYRHERMPSHDRMRRYGVKKSDLYDLKNRALDILIENTKAKPKGYHTFPVGDMDYYVIEGFGFHTFGTRSKKNLGELSTVCSERKRSIPPAKAQKLLTMFIEQNG